VWGKPRHLPQSLFSFSQSFVLIKHHKYLGREFNHGHCLTHNFNHGHCLSHVFFLATALVFPCLRGLFFIRSRLLCLLLYIVIFFRVSWRLMEKKTYIHVHLTGTKLAQHLQHLASQLRWDHWQPLIRPHAAIIRYLSLVNTLISSVININFLFYAINTLSMRLGKRCIKKIINKMILVISWQNHILKELHGHYVQQWLYIGLYFLLKDGWFKP